MTINNTYIEDILKNLLQKNIVFEIEGKILKKGKILLYTQKYFYINFILNTAKKKQEKIEIPIPFSITSSKDNKQIFFNYKVETLTQNNKEALNLIQDYINKTNIKNKFFNKNLTIRITNE